jgi:hypothetical protein
MLTRLPNALPALLAACIAATPLGAADGDLDLTFRGTGKFVYDVTSMGGQAAAVAPDGRLLIGYTSILSGTDRDMRLLPVPDQGFTLPCPSFHPDLGGTDEDVLREIAVLGNWAYVAGTAAGPPEDPEHSKASPTRSTATCSTPTSSSCRPTPRAGRRSSSATAASGCGRSASTPPVGTTTPFLPAASTSPPPTRASGSGRGR